MHSYDYACRCRDCQAQEEAWRVQSREDENKRLLEKARKLMDGDVAPVSNVVQLSIPLKPFKIA
jgi:hypothetical protein